ncbi:glycoside hydrolase family 28 protein [Parapedobacter sp. 2B3]|uniref:glycoside hydrolase family 28 protein n=1 Tax=Parapedobacter sp. 2B3 TaxID=3342381 RepID=UPI0035B65B89
MAIAATLSGRLAASPIIYNIVDFGAVNDGFTVNTAAINEAISTCAAQGGGQVVIPPGTFLSGTITLLSNVELHLATGSVLLASTDRADFPRQPQPTYRSLKDKGGWFALVYALEAQNIAITGKGTIDGNGAKQQPDPALFGGDLDGRPRNILFISCKGVRVEGVRMRNSGMWNQHYLDCEDLLIDRIEVYNHSNRNNDGIDIDGCRRVVVSNSIIDSDDDGITLKSTGPAPTEDVVITNCVVSSFCNAIKAGTESTGGFRNISISNCVVKPSRSKARPVFDTPRHGITGISLEIVDGGTMEGVTINNITIEGTECPLYIRLGNRARKYMEDVPTPPVGSMRNISISNLVAYNTGNFSSSITAIPGHYIENVQLSNVQFFNRGGLRPDDYIQSHIHVIEDERGYPQPTVWANLPSSLLFIRHAKNISLIGFQFGSKSSDSRPPIVAVDVDRLLIDKGLYSGPATRNVEFFVADNVHNPAVSEPLGWNKL